MSENKIPQKDPMGILWREARKIFKKVIRDDSEKYKIYQMTINKLYKIAGKPEGNEGILYSTFASSRAVLYKWALPKFNLDFNGRILDIGFGLGFFIQALAKTIKIIGTKGKIYGIDHSKTMTTEASLRNIDYINEGLISLHQCEVSKMPIFKDNFFTNILSFATVGFFPNLIEDLREIYRVLKPGCEFTTILQMYDNEKLTTEQIKKAKISNFNLYSLPTLKDAFREANFTNINISQHIDKPFSLIRGTKH